jgi:hypothetical protein
MRAAAVALLLAACTAPPDSPTADPPARLRMDNPVVWFEIPVTDMDRAVRFYGAVFGWSLDRQRVDGYDMAFLPAVDGEGSAGALASGDVYVPAKAGPLLYFRVEDIDATLARAVEAGGRILYPRKDVGAPGFVGEFEDSEGNRIALIQPGAAD